jgi:hypothetical protein
MVAVTAVKEDRMSGNAEAVFTVTLSGLNQPMYFRAYERSAKATVILRDEHHKLLTAWHRYRAGKNLGSPSIYSFGNLHLNLIGISAIGEMDRASAGNKWAGASTPTYEIYLLGLNEPIKRRLSDTGHESVEQLAMERELLLDAWRSWETVGTA